jgi:hypothetical protein
VVVKAVILVVVVTVVGEGGLAVGGDGGGDGMGEIIGLTLTTRLPPTGGGGPTAKLALHQLCSGRLTALSGSSLRYLINQWELKPIMFIIRANNLSLLLPTGRLESPRKRPRDFTKAIPSCNKAKYIIGVIEMMLRIPTGKRHLASCLLDL